ncbi:MAG: Gfo/Idh/MocA family oxidoreductase [Planctomycetales bacterium]|nr:Gfo/Idh/MocA family oxidoreductase [Planctomycetales bacterium]
MNEPTYRAGIIGLGFIGGGDQVSGDRVGQRLVDLNGNHREALSNHPRVQLMAGSSRDAGRRERFAQRTGARTYDDWRQMLATEQLEVVSVASFAPSHAELVVACAETGVRAILCEKPIATRLADAERMIAACQASGSLLVINHNRRFHPHFRQLAVKIAAGELGELTGIWLQWGSGRLGNVGTHFIDAAMMLTGRHVRAVSATLDSTGRPDCRGPEFRDPGGWAVLRFDAGLIGHVHAPDNPTGPAEVVVQGTLGRACIGGGIAEIEFWSGQRETLPNAPASAGNPMDQTVREIVAWLDDGTPVCCSAEESLRTLEVIIACHASHARQAAWTELPLTGADREREVQSG